MIVRTTKQRIRRIAFGVAAVAVFVPVSVSQSGDVTSNEAVCADDQCCPEFMSICGQLTDYYYELGKCPPAIGG